MTVIVGIDPGNSGALVALQDGQVLAHTLMPIVARGSNSRVNGSEVGAWLKDVELQAGGWTKVHVYLESVSGMPGQGVASTFTFGHAAGLVEGVIQGCGLSYTLVRPQEWKKRAGIRPGADKDEARALAVRKWPRWRELALKGKGQALADAALIAAFGQRAEVMA